MTFKAPMDTASKLITGFVIVLLVTIALWNCVFLPATIYVKLGLGLLFVVILFVPWLYRPLRYEVTDSEIKIVRPISSVSISFSAIVNIRVIDNKELGTLIRVFGSGGYFGFFGKFRSTRMGRLTLYATRRSGMVLVDTEDSETILLSPDSPERFLLQINAGRR